MIVITTPTGNIGKHLLTNVLKSNVPVRVIVRDASIIPLEQRERVDVVEGSHDALATVRKAFQGADTVFWLAPPTVQSPSLEAAYIDFARPACDAFVQGGIKRVVGISALGRGTPLAERAGIVTASLAMDDLIASTGVGYRALTMRSFMDNLLQQATPLEVQGMFFSPLHGDRKAPTCAIRDIAAAATRLLLDPSWTGVEEVPVLGPEDLSPNDLAAILSEVLKRTIRFQQIPFEAFKQRLLERGVSPAFAQGYVEMVRAKDEGPDNAVPRTAKTATPTSSNKPVAYYDLFRVENGKIAEHWDVIENIPPQSEWRNQNGKF